MMMIWNQDNEILKREVRSMNSELSRIKGKFRAIIAKRRKGDKVKVKENLLNANQLEDRLIEQTLLTKNEAIYYGWTKYYSGVIIDVNSDGTYYIHFKEPEDRRINGITDAQIEEDGDSLWNMQPLKEDRVPTVDGFGFRTDVGQEQYSKDNDINDITESQKVINNNTPPLTFADFPISIVGWDSPPPGEYDGPVTLI